jgi:hypothetical protein
MHNHMFVTLLTCLILLKICKGIFLKRNNNVIALELFLFLHILLHVGTCQCICTYSTHDPPQHMPGILLSGC